MALSTEGQFGLGKTGYFWDGMSAADPRRTPVDVRKRAECHLSHAQDKAPGIVSDGTRPVTCLAKWLMKLRKKRERDIETFGKEMIDATELS
ncbi:MAG: hypothetical protein ACQEVT_18635 [Pseudomonadota bacterium]|uniref:hypothetical protein n=1 Tax=Roseovarius TaxID=74030 RepID=UPI0022A87E17|nr:hypothetical protein [Roseovarius sp. EGI FJ00037]MCZ0812511.1 hypothetical protein [Roseovarius sp. EGI FJ00037]